MASTLLPFLENVGEFFAANYFGEALAQDIIAKSGLSSEGLKDIRNQLTGLRGAYERYKQAYTETAFTRKSALDRTREWHDELLSRLGYATDGDTLFPLTDTELIPVRHIYRDGKDRPQLFVMEMGSLMTSRQLEELGGFDKQGYTDEGWTDHLKAYLDFTALEEEQVLSKDSIQNALRTLFLLPEDLGQRPRYVLLLAGSDVFLLEEQHWLRGSYLHLNIDELFATSAAVPQWRELLYCLLGKPSLVPTGGQALLDTLSEESHKKAVAVTKDLKQGVVLAVEALANEVVWFLNRKGATGAMGKGSFLGVDARGANGGPPDTARLNEIADATATAQVNPGLRASDAAMRLENAPLDPKELAEQCLRVVYRLLFLFYAESREELELLPLQSSVYQRGYSLDMLRELEHVKLTGASREGYFIDDSLQQLFGLLWQGHSPHLLQNKSADQPELSESFGMRRIDSPLFDPDKLPLLKGVRVRNIVWQQIIERLSLSNEKKGRDRGRISYANLDINQLGSVYEGLLAYRGIFAEEELIEVHKQGKPEEGTSLVARSKYDDFKNGESKRGVYDAKNSEILHDEQNQLVVHPAGSFVYRLNGRDRQKSASYYTPESLTRTTVYFALEEVRERLKASLSARKAAVRVAARVDSGPRGSGLRLRSSQGAPPSHAAMRQEETPNSRIAASSLLRPEFIRPVSDVSDTSSGLDAIIHPMSASDLMSLTILEPAMGAAAFQNEAINQLAELYLEYRQEEVVAAGGQRINPNEYRTELRKVKAYIAANNVYGVDLNATAIELGRLSLWLNCLHTGMETPYFGHRLGFGNAVVGCWLKTYPKGAFLFDAKNPKRKLEWWKKEPTDVRLPFASTNAGETVTGFRKPERSKDSVYHFLLPDAGMVAAADNKLVKQHYKAQAERARRWREGFCESIKTSEHVQLVRLSAKLDTLLVEHLQQVDRVNSLNASNQEYYGKPAETGRLSFDYRQKEQHLEQLQKDQAPYARIRMVMDYWCALWYWDVRDAEQLPSRAEYLREVAAILEVDLDVGPHRNIIDSELDGEGNDGLDGADPFGDAEQLYDLLWQGGGQQASLWGTVEQLPLRVLRDREVMYESAREKVMALTNRPQLYEDHPRLTLVAAFAKTHRFFHQQLEFYEVFARRGGFDLVLGNPPWIKLEFDEGGIVSEIDPSVMVQKTSAPQIRKRIAGLLQEESFAELYFDELTSMEGASNFLNAAQNYPLLKGQQTNLYKCVVEVGFRQIGQVGVMGLVHPEGLYDDPKGAKMRREIYRRLKYHFQFKNELALFEEVHHEVYYGIHLYGSAKTNISFQSISNLFSPSTVIPSFRKNSIGNVGGYKDFDEETGRSNWNITPHSDRVVIVRENELRTFARAFENSDDWEGAKLVSVHAKQIVSVLEKLSDFKGRVGDVTTFTTECWHETNSQDKGFTLPSTQWPNLDAFELIYSGPHFFVGTPLYKTPRQEVTNNSHYDVIDLTQIPEDFVPRTNYVPATELVQFAETAGGGELPWGGRWIDQYKVAFSRRLSISGERTLQPAIIPPKVSHVHPVLSTTFEKESDLLEVTGCATSLLYDFLTKTIGRGDLYGSTLESWPAGLAEPYRSHLIALTLRLNCLTRAYAPLWERNWRPENSALSWSLDDPRLSAHANCTSTWSFEHSALRNAFERRWALVEIDVLVAKALGLSFEELKLIYEVQFPVLQQNELDTYYDARGSIVWTCSKGLKGVGIHDRKVWEALKAEERGVGSVPYRHVIDKAYSELYGGEERYFWGPYTRRDRVEDYLGLWKTSHRP